MGRVSKDTRNTNKVILKCNKCGIRGPHTHNVCRRERLERPLAEGRGMLAIP